MSVLNYQRLHCLLRCLFRRKSKKTSKLRVTGLCVGNLPVTDEFPAQKASNVEHFFIWWRHHEWCMGGFQLYCANMLSISPILDENTEIRMLLNGTHASTTWLPYCLNSFRMQGLRPASWRQRYFVATSLIGLELTLKGLHLCFCYSSLLKVELARRIWFRRWFDPEHVTTNYPSEQILVKYWSLGQIFVNRPQWVMMTWYYNFSYTKFKTKFCFSWICPTTHFTIRYQGWCVYERNMYLAIFMLLLSQLTAGSLVTQIPSNMMTSPNGNIFRVLALCAESSPVKGEFLAKRPVIKPSLIQIMAWRLDVVKTSSEPMLECYWLNPLNRLQWNSRNQ